MKRNTTFIFAGIMSAIIGNAYATGENIVTSKSYVDNALEQKQNKIEAYNNNEYQSVLTDTTTDGLVGKMKIGDTGTLDFDIFNDPSYYDNVIPTAGAIAAVTQAKMYCAGWPDSVPVADRTDANCWLWNKN